MYSSMMLFAAGIGAAFVPLSAPASLPTALGLFTSSLSASYHATTIAVNLAGNEQQAKDWNASSIEGLFSGTGLLTFLSATTAGVDPNDALRAAHVVGAAEGLWKGRNLPGGTAERMLWGVEFQDAANTMRSCFESGNGNVPVSPMLMQPTPAPYY